MTHQRLHLASPILPLVVAAAAMAIALPYITGRIGPVVVEAWLWGVVVFALGMSLLAVVSGPLPTSVRRLPIIVRIVLLVAVVGLATLAIMGIASDHYSQDSPPPEWAAATLLLVAWVAMIRWSPLQVRATRPLLIALTLRIAAAQVPASLAWIVFERRLDMPDPKLVTTHTLYALPHLVLGALALWSARAEIAAKRERRSTSSALAISETPAPLN